jgi:ADP-ribose pyrophosphatase
VGFASTVHPADGKGAASIISGALGWREVEVASHHQQPRIGFAVKRMFMTDFANATPTTVDVVKRERCYEGFYKLDRLHLRHELFAGGMSREINREVFVRHDAVCLLPYDPQRDEVVLIEQFRVGAMGKTDNPWLVELVAGLIDKEEVPEEVAHREAQEEAGLDIKALWPMTQYFPSPGGSNEYVHLFLGRCSTEGVGGLHGLEEEAEDIRVTVWAFEDALQAVRDGRIANAASIIALQWLALNRAEVRGLWS